MTLGASGEATAFPGAPSSSALGPDADILAFLQAMVDASALADAGAGALDPSAPARIGESTDAAGASPAQAVVSPWNEVFFAKHPGLRMPLLGRQAHAASAQVSPQEDADASSDAAVAQALFAAATAAAAPPVRVSTSTPVIAEPPAELSAPTDDDESASTAFLLAAATQPVPPQLITPTTIEPQVSSATTESNDVEDALDQANPPSAPVAQGSTEPLMPVVAAPVMNAVPPLVTPPVPTPVSTPSQAPTNGPVEADMPRTQSAALDRSVTPEPLPSVPSMSAAEYVEAPEVPKSRNEMRQALAREARTENTSPSGLSDVVDPLPLDHIDSEPEVSLPSLPSTGLPAKAEAATPEAQTLVPTYAPRVGAVQPRPNHVAQASPRVQAVLRDVRLETPAVERTLPLPADTMLSDVAVPASELASFVDEPRVWTSAVAQAAATLSGQPARVRPSEGREAAFNDDDAAQARLTSAMAVHRLMDNALPVPQAPRRDAHEPLVHSERRPSAPAFGHDFAAAAMAITSGSALEAPAQTVKPTEAPAEPRSLPNESANAASIVRSMHWQYRNGVGTAVVQLDPGYLGEVRVALRVDGNTVTATLHAANAEVRAWMQANEGALRQSLTAQGLSLDTLIIAEEQAMDQRTSPDGRGQSEREPEQQRRARTQTTDNEGRTFEIVV